MSIRHSQCWLIWKEGFKIIDFSSIEPRDGYFKIIDFYVVPAYRKKWLVKTWLLMTQSIQLIIL